MFSAYCAGCGAEVLLSPRRVVHLRNTDDGVVVVFRCWNGHVGQWLTGRGAAGGRRLPDPGPVAPVASPAGAAA